MKLIDRSYIWVAHVGNSTGPCNTLFSMLRVVQLQDLRRILSEKGPARGSVIESCGIQKEISAK